MSIQAVLLPVFVLVAMTFAIQFWMGYERFKAVKSGQTRPEAVALGEPGWPSRPTQIANSFSNQFELPLLFYVLVALALFTRKADLLFVLLSWVFVVTRFAHAYIHTGSNRMIVRFQAYFAGALVLMAMWIVFALQILLGL